jgi:alanyl-tRNA synthetase
LCACGAPVAGPVDASQLAAVETICREQLAKDYQVSTLEVALPKAKEINGLRSVGSVWDTAASVCWCT